MEINRNIEKRLYPDNLKSELIEPCWLRGMKCFPSTIKELDIPSLMGGVIDEEGDYVIPEIFLASKDREYIFGVAELFMDKNGGIADYIIKKELPYDIIFEAENDLFVVKVIIHENLGGYLLTVSYYGNYGRHEDDIYNEEIREFGVSHISEYFTNLIPSLGCVYGRSERSTGGYFFFSKEDDEEYHLTAFSENCSELLKKLLMVSSGLTKEVFDFDLGKTYPAVKAYENHLNNNPYDSFEYSNSTFKISLSIGNTLFRLDVYIPKTEINAYPDYNKNFVGKLLNDLAWIFSEKKDFKKAQSLIDKSLELGETKFNLDTAAVLLHKQGKIYDALECINRSLSLDENVSNHYLTRAKIFIAKGDMISARNDLNKSLELNEDNEEAGNLLKHLKN